MRWKGLLGRDGTTKGTKSKGHLVAAIMQRKLDCKGWRLVTCGHSLGAGAAALIALRLHDRFEGEVNSLSRRAMLKGPHVALTDWPLHHCT